MIALEEYLPESIFAIAVVFFRLGAAFMLMPGFSEMYILPQIRLLLALCISFVIAPVIAPLLPAMPTSIPSLVLLILQETLIGIFFGAIAAILITSTHSAGNFISMMSGLATAQYFDPAQGGQTTAIGRFLLLVVLTVLFSLDMHHLMIEGIFQSFAVFPPDGAVSVGDLNQHIARTVSDSFMVAFKLASPFIVGGILIYLASGILSRLMPTMQVFFVLLPVQIILSFALLLIMLLPITIWLMSYFENGIMGIVD
jgi:flagellar biosynthetic protein FliR